MRSASLNTLSQLKGSGWGGAAALEALGESERAAAPVVEWVGDFLVFFWFSGDLAIAGDVILKIEIIFFVHKRKSIWIILGRYIVFHIIIATKIILSYTLNYFNNL